MKKSEIEISITEADIAELDRLNTTIVVPTQETVDELVDKRIEYFFSGKCVDNGLREEFRKELKGIACSLRKFFKKEIENKLNEVKMDFIKELRSL